MAKIHVVTQGEYSGYTIVAVFSEDQEEAAITFAALVDGCVEQYDLNPSVPADPGNNYYMLEMTKDGKLTQTEPSPRAARLEKDGRLSKSHCWHRTHKDSQYERKSYWRLTWYGYADSLEHAVKIMNELRSQILAGQCPPGVDMGKNIPESASQTEGVR